MPSARRYRPAAGARSSRRCDTPSPSTRTSCPRSIEGSRPRCVRVEMRSGSRRSAPGTILRASQREDHRSPRPMRQRSLQIGRARSRQRRSPRDSPTWRWTLGTCRRMRASSMTSSWYKEARWTSSTAMPPWIVSSLAGEPASDAEASASAGRMRFPTGDDQVGDHVVEECVATNDGDSELLLEPGQLGFRCRQREEIGGGH